MDRINVDINETEIFNLYPEVLETLLKDHTTGRNIFWATDSYAHRGDGFQYSDAITVGHTTACLEEQGRTDGTDKGNGRGIYSVMGL